MVKSLLRKLLRVGPRVAIEGTRFETIGGGEQVQIISVRLRKRRSKRGLCGRCRAAVTGPRPGRPDPTHLAAAGPWHHQGVPGGLEASGGPQGPRPDGGRGPWARHGVGCTHGFEDQVAWLAVHTSKTAIVELTRIAWRTVGVIVERVCADARAARDPLDGLPGSGSTRSRIARAIVTSPWWSIRHRPAGVGRTGP